MSDEWVMAPREASEAMIRAGYSAPTVFGVRDMANTYRAMLAAAPDAPQRNREADRARYIDRAFNEWLDDSVADGGATVWDLVSDVHSAWAAWTAHPHYAAPAAPQQAEPVAWMAFGGALVHAVTRNAMDPIEAERFDVPLYLHPPAAPQQAEPVEIVPRVWREALRKLTFMARTSGGTPGPDEGLQTACAEAETLLSKPYNYPPAAPQQAEPAAQIGWADEFGNLFPMGAWKPTQRTYHDSHKTAWRAVYLHSPAAEVHELRTAALALLNELDAGRHGAHEFNNLRNALRGGE